MNRPAAPGTPLADAPAATASPWLAFWIASSAVFLVSLDSTMLFAALEALRHSFTGSSTATLSWVLNVAWNPLFFTAHRTGWALVDIAALLVLIGGMAWTGRAASGGAVLGAVPYVVWLTVATSLNAYIVVANR